MEYALKECPFCGKQVAEVHLNNESERPQYYVICNFTKGGCGSSSGAQDTASEAVDLWNTRPSMTFQTF